MLKGFIQLLIRKKKVLKEEKMKKKHIQRKLKEEKMKKKKYIQRKLNGVGCDPRMIIHT